VDEDDAGTDAEVGGDAEVGDDCDAHANTVDSTEAEAKDDGKDEDDAGVELKIEADEDGAEVE
jgi:hypothetical protein